MTSSFRSTPVVIKFENARKRTDGSYRVSSQCSDISWSNGTVDETLAMEIAGIPPHLLTTEMPGFSFLQETVNGTQQGFIQFDGAKPWPWAKRGAICKFTGTDFTGRPEYVQAITEDGQSGYLSGILSDWPDTPEQDTTLSAADQGKLAFVVKCCCT